MKINATNIYFILFGILCSFNSYGQDNKSTEIKKKAEDAFYKIFNTYRMQNCDSLISFLNDSIIFINTSEDTIFKTSDILNPNQYCDNMFSSVNLNLDEPTHRKYYGVKVFTVEEFSKFKDLDSFNDSTLINLSIDTKFSLMFLANKAHRFDKNDVFVTGAELKNRSDFYEETESKWIEKPEIKYKIGWAKQYFFVLRKTKNGWKIKAMPT